MPDNIPSGVYTLDMYVNGNKITSHTKIRVLSGIYSERVIPLMPIVYVPSYDANEFILHDKIYYMCGRLIYTWDLKNNNWTKKNDLNVNNGNEYSSVIDANFNYDNSQYVFIQKYSGNNGDISKLQLMKYNETQDNWQFITEFPDEFPPVIGNRIFTFILGDCLYLGYKKSDYKDLWEFNFKTNSWTKKNKLPDGMHGFVSDDCSFETTGFIITNFRELWQYNPSSDSWQLLTTLEAGPYIRYDTRLIYNNGFIYVLGGKTGNDEDYLADFWRYNLSTKLWDYIWLCQFTYNCTAPKFIYNNKILMIPGFNYDYNSNYSAEITL